MATPLPKKVQPAHEFVDEVSRYETAAETMAAYIGYLTNQIIREEDKEQPNSHRIRALREEKDIVVRERHEMTPETESLILKALYIYAPFIKALRS